MKFSIVIPAYNIEDYIGKCLDSILSQTYSDYETGKTHVPVEILMGLSEIYGTSVDYLVELTDEKKPYPRQNRHERLF